MQQVPPRHPWQIPVESDALVASALAYGRPSVVAARDRRLNGATDVEVAERYRVLRQLVFSSAQREEAILTRLQSLEASDPATAWTRWQTSVMRVDADDDPAVIRAAQDVWDALGPNAFALEFKHRPQTYVGFLEGRLWMLICVLGSLALVFGGIGLQTRYGAPWWLSLPAIAGCSWGVWRMFDARYRAGERIADKELPHV